VSRERRPRVALVTDAIHPFHRGGKEIRYHEVARRLARRADVHVYTMKWWPGPRVRRADGVTFHAICPRLLLYAGDRRSIPQALAFAAACLGLLFARFDVIEADHMPYVQLFPLRLVAWLRRKRLVVTWHEHWGPDYWRAYLGPAWRAGWLAERLAMRLPDRLVAASPGTAERLREHVGDRIPLAVAPNGVDFDLIARSEPAPARSDAVVVGRLLGHKRLDLLLAALAVLRDRGLPVTARVIGDGPGRESVAAEVRARGLERLVELRHDVASQEELYALLKAARVFVFPSEREGFGIAVLEALACGLPVVTTSAPGNQARHLVARAARGVVCEPDAEALAAALERVLASAGGPRQPPETWVRDYDWEAVAERVAEAVLT
jgi:glycosyltransferase involved in cell wall biosynthesis